MSRILVPFDFSENAIHALDQAFLLAAQTGSDLEVLHITNAHLLKEYPKSWASPVTPAVIDDHLSSAVNSRKAAVDTHSVNVQCTVTESTLVSGGIISHILSTHPVLLVMGTHGWTGIADKLLGSNTSSLITHALFPILAVPPNWKPTPLKKAIANVELKNLDQLLPSLEHWAAFMATPVEVVQFSSVPDIEKGASAQPTPGSSIHVAGVVQMLDDLTLAENIAQYASAHENAYCIMFVHERKWFEKIFDGSISEKVSGIIESPLLAIPIKK